MRYLLFIIKLIFLFSINQLYAQQDFTFQNYPSSKNINSILLNLTSNDDAYYLLQYNFIDNKNFTSIIKTDLNGIEISRLDSIVINDYTISSPNHIFSTKDRIILVSMIVNQGGANTYSSYTVDFDLKNLNVIDQIKLDTTTIITNRRFKFNKYKQIYESIGIESVENSSEVISSTFIQLDTTGKFIAFENFDVRKNLSDNPVLDFTPLPDGRYFASYFARRVYLIDENLNPIDSAGPNYYRDLPNGQREISSGSVYQTYDVGNNQIACTSPTEFDDNYAYLLALYGVRADTISIDTFFPLMPDGSTEPVFLGEMILDNNEDIISVVSGQMSPFGFRVDTNALFIAKNKPDGTPVWKIQFANDTELMVRRMITDVNNDIILVGEHWSEDFPGERQNFLLKVYADGTLTNITPTPTPRPQLNIYPNPTTDFLHIENDQWTDNWTAFIHSTDGRLMHTQSVSALDNQIDVQNLAQGHYFVSFYDGSGMVVGSVKFVKQ